MCSPATARCEKVLFFTTIACTPKNAARATNFTKKQVLGQKSWSAAGPLHATSCSFRQLHCALLFSKGPALPRKHSGTPARRPGDAGLLCLALTCSFWSHEEKFKDRPCPRPSPCEGGRGRLPCPSALARLLGLAAVPCACPYRPQSPGDPGTRR